MKTPHRAKIIKKQFGTQKDNKNAYILFKTQEQASRAKKLNQSELLGKHLRVDLEDSKHDYDATLFMGNLPFTINEEDLRAHIATASPEILNIRVIRDPGTHMGKGIAYVQFVNKAVMRLALEQLNGSKFQGRELRCKKATPKERLEKKAKKVADVVEQKKAAKEATAAEQLEQARILRDQQMESEDSEDEKPH